MKKSIILLCVLLLACSCLFSCAKFTFTGTPQEPSARENAFGFPTERSTAWTYSSAKRAFLEFSTADELVEAVKSRDMALLAPRSSINGTEQEIPYMHMVYTLWAIGSIPVLENEDAHYCRLYPQAVDQSVAVEYGIEIDGKEAVVTFLIKDAVNVAQYNAEYEENGTVVTVEDKKYGGIYHTQENATYFTIDRTSYIMQVEVASKDAVSVQEICEIIHNLKIIFSDLYAT